MSTTTTTTTTTTSTTTMPGAARRRRGGIIRKDYALFVAFVWFGFLLRDTWNLVLVLTTSSSSHQQQQGQDSTTTTSSTTSSFDMPYYNNQPLVSSVVLDGGRAKVSTRGYDDGDTNNKNNNNNNNTSNNKKKKKISSNSNTNTMHVLLALADNQVGFFREVEILLKSLLLNAPEYPSSTTSTTSSTSTSTSTLVIHIMADGPAYAMLEQLFYSSSDEDEDKEGESNNNNHNNHNHRGPSATTTTTTTTNLHLWKSKNPVIIQTYNCESYLPQWKRKIRSLYRRGGMDIQSARRDLEYHTMGTWFRLLAHKVLTMPPPTLPTPLLPPLSPPRKYNNHNHNNTTTTATTATIENVLYLDSDVVLLANLQDLWKHYYMFDNDVDHDHDDDDNNSLHPNYYFQWGASQCAGFLILNVPKLEEMWNIVDSFGLNKARQEIIKMQQQQQTTGSGGGGGGGSSRSSNIMADQLFLRTVQLSQPDRVGRLPDRWDNTMASTLWRWKTRLVEKRPQIGYIHFNGGGYTQHAWFLENDSTTTTTTNATTTTTTGGGGGGVDDEAVVQQQVLYDHAWLTSKDARVASSFGIADYYIRLPWKWARYFAEAKIPPWSNGSRIEIHYKNRTTRTRGTKR